MERKRRYVESALVPSVAETAERASLQRELMEAVTNLKASQRDVILRRYLDGLPPRGIARRLGVGGDTVRSRFSRGLAASRSRLDRGRDGNRGVWTSAFIAHFLEQGQGASLKLKDGGSDVAVVDELSRTLVRWKDGQEVRRVPIRLMPGEVRLLRL